MKGLKSGSTFLENHSETVHKYDHVVLRGVSTSCTLKRGYAMPVKAVEISTKESNDPKQSLIRN